MLNNNDRVRLTYWHERVGVVTRAGPEQSEVKWNDDGIITNNTNENLEKISGSPNAYTPPQSRKPNAASVKLSSKALSGVPENAVLVLVSAKFKPGSFRQKVADLVKNNITVGAFRQQGSQIVGNQINSFLRDFLSNGTVKIKEK